MFRLVCDISYAGQQSAYRMLCSGNHPEFLFKGRFMEDG